MGHGYTSTALAALMLAVATPVIAQSSDSVRRFDIAAGPLERTLPAFGRQSGLQILYPSALVAGRQSPAVSGDYPSARDRRQYLDGIIEEAKPSFGHRALAMLMRENLTHTVWTTNFDKLVEDSAANIYGSTGRLTVADLGEPSKLQRAMQESRWPVLGKLHGDFHSDRLKNTSEELRDQDAAMRQAFVRACQGNGLALVGYSGRDASIISTQATVLLNGAVPTPAAGRSRMRRSRRSIARVSRWPSDRTRASRISVRSPLSYRRRAGEMA